MKRRNKSKSCKKLELKVLPFDIKIEALKGNIILDMLKGSNIPVKATCGGQGTCGECIIKILSGRYQSNKSAAISERLVDQGYSLACMTHLQSDVVIQLPEFQHISIKSITDSDYFDKNKNSISGIYEVNPIVKSVNLKMPAPTLDNKKGDLDRLIKQIKKQCGLEAYDCEYSVLRKLAYALRDENGNVNVILFKKEENWTIIDVEAGRKRKHIYGIACDLGTTTVSIQIVDLSTGELLCTTSSYNQQMKCGEDIISRINYARTPDGLKELQILAVETINNLIDEAIKINKITQKDLYYASVSGNTTMVQLLLGLDPQYIREEPYVPTFNKVPFVSSSDIKLKMNKAGKVHCSPAVGSYVGGDITAGLLCTPILRNSEDVSIFMDIGTNGEIVMGNQDWLIACACSAGPAFEGSGIKCGMPATDGAVEKIEMMDDNELELKVIGDSKPKGICGSGLIDILAELFTNGIVNRSGKIESKGEHLKEINGKGFIIADSNECYWDRDLVLSEKDIANAIRTKAAVYSAYSLIMKNLKINSIDIDAFYIAGGFGRHLNIENAVRIGLFPDITRDKYHYLGNSSLLGAYLILISDKNRVLVNSISEKITYIELNTEPSYMNEYTGALFLPHTDIELFPSVKDLINPK